MLSIFGWLQLEILSLIPYWLIINSHTNKLSYDKKSEKKWYTLAGLWRADLRLLIKFLVW